MSTTSSKMLARKIDLDRRRAKLQAIHVCDLATAKVDAAATTAEARLQLEGEEKYTALSESGSFVAVLGR